MAQMNLSMNRNRLTENRLAVARGRVVAGAGLGIWS